MTGMLRVPRSRGALSGVLLVLLGAWGGLIPFIGPHFHYAYTPDTTWTYTQGRLWLEILPGAATLLGGLIVLANKIRPVAMLGGWLAALGGGWFAVGGVLSGLWMKGGATATGTGTPVGGTVARVVEQIGFFTGLGVVIVFLAALALGRLAVVGVKDAKLAAREKEVSAPASADTPADVSTAASADTPADVSSRASTDTPANVDTPAEASSPADAGTPDNADAPEKVNVVS